MKYFPAMDVASLFFFIYRILRLNSYHWSRAYATRLPFVHLIFSGQRITSLKSIGTSVRRIFFRTETTSQFTNRTRFSDDCKFIRIL